MTDLQRIKKKKCKKKNQLEEEEEPQSPRIGRIPQRADQWITRNIVGNSQEFRKSIIDFKNKPLGTTTGEETFTGDDATKTPAAKYDRSRISV